MKLKYYFRGLGAGILFTAVVFSFVIIPQYKMNDQEIVDAANEIEAKEAAKVEDAIDLDVIDQSPTPIVTEKPGDTTSPTITVSVTSAVSPKPTNSPSSTNKPTVTPNPTSAPTMKPTVTSNPTSAPTDKPTVTPKPTVPTDKPTVTPKPNSSLTNTPAPTSLELADEVVVEITRGMTSENFSKLLQKNGLIEDAVDFNTYMVENDYANYIRVGVFEIPIGSNYQDIVRIVTNNR